MIDLPGYHGVKHGIDIGLRALPDPRYRFGATCPWGWRQVIERIACIRSQSVKRDTLYEKLESFSPRPGCAPLTFETIYLFGAESVNVPDAALGLSLRADVAWQLRGALDALNAEIR
jgi:hypothetical protein